VSFVDDFSKFSWVFLLHGKSEVEDTFLKFKKHVELLLDRKIKGVQSDWGGEYRRFHKYFDSTGITHTISCPHTHQQNGCAERKHSHIVETGLALLAQASMPVKFWDDAFSIATYLINRLPTRVIDNATPLERLLGASKDKLLHAKILWLCLLALTSPLQHTKIVVSIQRVCFYRL
jgi:histone deacetylase 1/2